MSVVVILSSFVGNMGREGEGEGGGGIEGGRTGVEIVFFLKSGNPGGSRVDADNGGMFFFISLGSISSSVFHLYL